MKEQLLKIKSQYEEQLSACTTLDDLDALKIKILGKKGELTSVLKDVSSLPVEDRPVLGKLANEIKTELSKTIDTKREQLETEALNHSLSHDDTDIHLPSFKQTLGSRHPIDQTIDDIVSIFSRLGFCVKEGPDVETEAINFEALNIPADHPARDMHDTFYLKSGDVLRTHTSPVQIRSMLKKKPPIRMLAPGKVYRCDADASHSPVFHQIEGLVVEKGIHMSDLKGTLEFFLKSLFGNEKKVRFRPSYFPFTEPSTEVDVECVICKGDGCSLCKQTGWLEVLGAGMVQRHVFRYVDYDPQEWTGFAFGLGVDRIAMLKYGIDDIRLLYENDLRFLKQF